MSENVCIKLMINRNDDILVKSSNLRTVYTPGDIVTQVDGSMRGYGTYEDGDDLKSSIAGVTTKVQSLLTVKPCKQRYHAEIGDIVIGRIIGLKNDRWRVDIRSWTDAVLPLSSFDIKTGEKRRKKAEDEQNMREHLTEGDVVIAEVHELYDDGSILLHTRNHKYGKLFNGTLVKVPSSLISKSRKHFHTLPCGGDIKLGCNGLIWITPGENYATDLNPDENTDKHYMEVVARIKNCIEMLSYFKIAIYDVSIDKSFDESLQYKPHELLDRETMVKVISKVQNILKNYRD